MPKRCNADLDFVRRENAETVRACSTLMHVTTACKAAFRFHCKMGELFASFFPDLNEASRRSLSETTNRSRTRVHRQKADAASPLTTLKFPSSSARASVSPLQAKNVMRNIKSAGRRPHLSKAKKERTPRSRPNEP